MNPIAYRATLLNIIGNTFLFIIKIFAGLVSGSVALVSDALNSLTDIISSIAVFICVRVSDKQADEGHPFGHSRAEPIAGLIVAILAGILGFEMIRSSVERLVSDGQVTVSPVILFIPLFTIVIKLVMGWYFRNIALEVKSPAIMASSVDSFCDVAVSAAAFIGILGVWLGYPVLDPLAGLAISIWIIYTGYSIGVENIDYLMGKTPGPLMMNSIVEAACSVAGVKSTNTIRAHYVGNFIHVEIHIEVDKDLKTSDSHLIGKRVEARIEDIDAINKSFVHIDPV